MKGKNIRIADDQMHRLEQIAELNSTTSSAVIRLAIDCLIDKSRQLGGHLPFAPGVPVEPVIEAPAVCRASDVSVVDDGDEYPEAVGFSRKPQDEAGQDNSK